LEFFPIIIRNEYRKNNLKSGREVDTIFLMVLIYQRLESKQDPGRRYRIKPLNVMFRGFYLLIWPFPLSLIYLRNKEINIVFHAIIIIRFIEMTE